MTSSLPPIGTIAGSDTNHAAAIACLERFALEGSVPRDEWTPVADINLTIYTFGANPQPGPNDLVVNEIQTHIIASQLQTPPGATLKPVETGEKADIYWAGPQAEGIALGLPVWNVSSWLRNTTTGAVTQPGDTEAQEIPAVPIEDETVGKNLLDMVEAGVIPDDHVVEINDRIVAETYQTAFDVIWRRSRSDEFVSENMLDNDVQGWTFGLYAFDDELKRHVLRHLPIKQVFMDPTVRDIAEAAYAGFDLPIDASEAKKLYPHLAKQIDEYAQTGQLQPHDANTTLGQAFDRDFQRPMVMFRCAWIRNELFPLSVEAALAMGKVEMREVPDESATGTDAGDLSGNGADGEAVAEDAAGQPAMGRAEPAEPAATGEVLSGSMPAAKPAMDSDATGGVETQAGGDAEPVGDDDVTNAAANQGGTEGADQNIPAASGGEANPPTPPMAAPPPVTRVAFFQPGTEVEVFPPESDQAMPEDAPEWPSRLGIRQMIQIDCHIVDDRESEYYDIPIIHNVNIPIPGKPFGIGEPMRLYAMQRAESRMVGSIVNHVEFFKAPMMIIPTDVNNSLAASQQKGFIKPGSRFIVDPGLVRQYGGADKMIGVINPPPMPPALIDALQVLTSKMTEQSGRTPVMRGETDPNAKSGVAIGLLQQGAASLIDYKHVRSGKMVARLGRLMLHSLVWRLEIEDLKKIVSKYKDHILEAIIEKARRSDWDVEVEETAGGIHAQQMKKAEAKDDYLKGLIDFQTYCERVGENYYQIMRRRKMQMMKEAAMVAQTGGIAPEGQRQQTQQTKQTQPGEKKQEPPKAA